MTCDGFFDLNTPQDLLLKLLHDHQRVIAAPGDRYAAMDFIIVANHLRDWVEKHNNKKVSNYILLDICRELANNLKHFVRRHRHVKEEKVIGGAFQFGAFDPSAFDVGYFAVELEGEATKQFGSELRLEELASRVVEFWKNEIGN